MNDPILQEIRRVREEHARECHYDVHVMFEQMREEAPQLEAEGWKFVSFAGEAMRDDSWVVREERPKR